MKKTTLFFIASSFLHFQASAGVIFQDDFEYGNLNKTMNGAFWANGAYANVTDKGPALSGTHSLKFTYKPGKNSWAEQRFDLGGKYSDIWIKWSIYIPQNFEKNGSRNNKLMYVDSRKTPETNNLNMYTGFEHWGDTIIGTQQAYQNSSSIGWMWADPPLKFLDSTEDKGKWHTFIFHLKKADSPNSSNGLIQVWKDGRLRMNITNLNNYSNGYNAYETGYLMGWANSGYSETENTYFYIDDVVFSDEPISITRPKSATSIRIK